MTEQEKPSADACDAAGQAASPCAHENKIIVGESDERTIYWCPQCGGSGSWGKTIDDIRWRLPTGGILLAEDRHAVAPTHMNVLSWGLPVKWCPHCLTCYEAGAPHVGCRP
jgi:hypothetical protein